jgi:hypothetical protein
MVSLQSVESGITLQNFFQHQRGSHWNEQGVAGGGV